MAAQLFIQYAQFTSSGIQLSRVTSVSSKLVRFNGQQTPCTMQGVNVALISASWLYSCKEDAKHLVSMLSSGTKCASSIFGQSRMFCRHRNGNLQHCLSTETAENLTCTGVQGAYFTLHRSAAISLKWQFIVAYFDSHIRCGCEHPEGFTACLIGTGATNRLIKSKIDVFKCRRILIDI